jgi:Ca2+/H+ antiporter, TMEM165/GDT1 family
MRHLSRGAKIGLLLLIAPVIIFLVGWIVMSLWNNVLVEVVDVSRISFWQAWGLLILSRMLFGGFGGSSRSRSSGSYWKKRMQEKWATMSTEEREQFRARWKNGKWGYRPWENDPGTQHPGVS